MKRLRVRPLFKLYVICGPFWKIIIQQRYIYMFVLDTESMKQSGEKAGLFAMSDALHFRPFTQLSMKLIRVERWFFVHI